MLDRQRNLVVRDAEGREGFFERRTDQCSYRFVRRHFEIQLIEGMAKPSSDSNERVGQRAIEIKQDQHRRYRFWTC